MAALLLQSISVHIRNWPEKGEPQKRQKFSDDSLLRASQKCLWTAMPRRGPEAGDLHEYGVYFLLEGAPFSGTWHACNTTAIIRTDKTIYSVWIDVCI